MTIKDPMFRIVEESREPVHRISREELLRAPHRFVAKCGFNVIVPDAIIEQLCALGRAKQPNEWMGILVGRLGRDSSGEYAVVDGLLCDSRAIASPARVQSTPTGEAILRRHARECFPASIVLGWAHGHLQCGAKFSGTDFANQATWTMPYALGIVCDPWSSERIAVYYGPKAELLVPCAELDPHARELQGPIRSKDRKPSTTKHGPGVAASAAPTDRPRPRLRPLIAALVVLGFGSSLWLQARTLLFVRRIEEHASPRPSEFAVPPSPSTFKRPWRYENDLEHTCPVAR